MEVSSHGENESKSPVYRREYYEMYLHSMSRSEQKPVCKREVGERTRADETAGNRNDAEA